jgi:hypothetical protein
MKKTTITSLSVILLFTGSLWGQKNDSNVRPVQQKTEISKENIRINEKTETRELKTYSAEEIQLLVSKAQSIDELPGFPVRKYTNNREQDELNYKLAKEKWYAENKALVEAFYAENTKRQPKVEKP